MLPDYGNCMQYSAPYGTHSTAAYQVPNMVPTGNAYETGEQKQQHHHVSMADMHANTWHNVGFAQGPTGFHNTM